MQIKENDLRIQENEEAEKMVDTEKEPTVEAALEKLKKGN